MSSSNISNEFLNGTYVRGQGLRIKHFGLYEINSNDSSVYPGDVIIYAEDNTTPESRRIIYTYDLKNDSDASTLTEYLDMCPYSVIGVVGSGPLLKELDETSFYKVRYVEFGDPMDIVIGMSDTNQELNINSFETYLIDDVFDLENDVQCELIDGFYEGAIHEQAEKPICLI